jgi:hypothetical protein
MVEGEPQLERRRRGAELIYEIASTEMLDMDGALPPDLQLVGIDEVSRDFTSIQHVLLHEGLKQATRAVVVVWGRGEDPADSNVWGAGVNLKTLVYEPIPDDLGYNHHLHPDYDPDRQ